AGPGEFTKRAFINGKLTLSEAEAVAGIIDAASEKHLGISLLQLEGSLSRKISDIYSKLTYLLSSVYAFIDYPDEDMTDIPVDEMKKTLSGILKELDALYESRKYGKAISEGVSAVIAGRPNTGKSSLLNFLSGSERAIVTDIEGTTRDVITEKITVGSIVLNLSDTAGIREGGDMIEKMGIERSAEAVKNAEIIILVLESRLTGGDEKVIKLIKDAGKEAVTVALYNKTDVNNAVFGGIFENEIAFSAKTGEGKARLEEIIAKLCSEAERGDDGTVIISARQFGALKRARNGVSSAIAALDTFTQDIAGMDIEQALAALGELDGREVTEEVVNGIFSHFCVGK
ncbi:MAG: tRNA uridine-5-carboxymethylaminomethyl(34) synthesis GTPase MnmE, partial [Victivallales bacterium]